MAQNNKKRKHMKNIVIGVLAHVDAGKTTLSEAILYNTGVIRAMGRVDNKDTMLDNNAWERARGITIFSKQACFDMGDTHITWLDTPGHVDFSAEMERTLQVLDYAVLVISATDGVQGHTRTLWRLLRQYNIPCFIFVNKMDQPDNDKALILNSLKNELTDSVVDFSSLDCNVFEELAVASGDESILNTFLADGFISDSDISDLIYKRKVYPCVFGSALKQHGVNRLLDIIDKYTLDENANNNFSARIYKITRDNEGNRLTHMKITGGMLKVRDLIDGEKVTQIRIYSGEKYESVEYADTGIICAVKGLFNTAAGQGLGCDKGNMMKLLEPVLSYRLILPDKISARKIYPDIKKLEEELPELEAEWNEEAEDISVKIMGQVQLEILTGLIEERLLFKPSFDKGVITYKETISDIVIGVGHFEPLRHYAEVHLKIEPAERGSGISVDTDCSEDILDKNWQRLITTHIREKSHKGVLTGAELTDVKITVINGRAHQKHTEGGDFRQATYRAIRQGLMQAESILLEPYYNFTIEIPADMIGRVMTDMDTMSAKIEIPNIMGEKAYITGRGPVYTMRDYQINLNAYTHGQGSMTVTFAGYDICHNAENIINTINYNPDNDTENPSSSVFCSHGAGFIVPWHEVYEYMHVHDICDDEYFTNKCEKIIHNEFDYSIGIDEIDEIISRTAHSNSRQDKHNHYKKKSTYVEYPVNIKPRIKNRKKLLIVDGYNVIFAWESLSRLAADNMDSAKDRLIHILSNYQGSTEIDIMLIFDGYKVKGNAGSDTFTDSIHIIHTKENQTADLYIENFTFSNSEKYDITVVTSDGMIQKIVRASDARIISSREFADIIKSEAERLKEDYNL